MIRAGIVGKRSLSTAIQGVSPRSTIAANLLHFKEIAAANSEAALPKGAAAVDVTTLPKEMAHMASYFEAIPIATGNVKFVKDGSAWQNQDFASFVGIEAGRRDTFPFMFSAVFTWLLLGVGLGMALPSSAKKNSKYISMIEGRHGKLEHGKK